MARAAAREGAAVAVTGRRREPGDALVGELEAAGTEAVTGSVLDWDQNVFDAHD